MTPKGRWRVSGWKGRAGVSTQWTVILSTLRQLPAGAFEGNSCFSHKGMSKPRILNQHFYFYKGNYCLREENVRFSLLKVPLFFPCAFHSFVFYYFIESDMPNKVSTCSATLIFHFSMLSFFFILSVSPCPTCTISSPAVGSHMYSGVQNVLTPLIKMSNSDCITYIIQIMKLYGFYCIKIE